MNSRLFLLTFFAFLACSFLPVDAFAQLPPTAVIRVDPNRLNEDGTSYLAYKDELITFDGSDSIERGTATYQWKLDGVNKVTTIQYQETFTATGSYTVSLTVENDEGPDTESITVVVKEKEGRFYYVKDHLGSIRATVDEDGFITNYTDYYPFGLTMPKRTLVGDNRTPENYTGHELDIETGLVYAGARYMIPEIGRWLSIDPLAEDFPSWSPYNYGLNDPIAKLDPTGLAACDITICGDNGSSITIETDLIDIEVDISSLGIDFGGNHSLNGEDVLLAGLDIVGIFDPSGLSDGLAALIYGEQGDLGNALISTVGLIPVIGDGAKAGRIGKSVNTLTDAVSSSQMTQRAARREAMRKAGIPTSQVPVSQMSTPAGRQLTFEVPKPGGGTETKIVQNQLLDRNHGPHIEAGRPKKNGQTDPSGRSRLRNDKVKVEYEKGKGPK